MTSTVSKGKVVSLEYTVKSDDNAVVDTNVGKDPLTYTQGDNQIIRGVETAVEGMMVGEAKHVIVTPADGYGSHDLTAVYWGPGRNVPEKIKVGMQLHGEDTNGKGGVPKGKKKKEETVFLDLNHPFAGKTLFFDVKVLDVH